MIKQLIYYVILLFIFTSAQAQEKPEDVKAANQQEASDEKRANEKKSPYENRRVLSIDFRGNTNVTSEKLRESMEFQKERKSYSTEKLQADLDRMRVLLYADEGYLQARFQEPEFEDTPNGLKITISIDEGLRYRAGELIIEDARLLSPEEVLKILRMKKGDIVKGYSVVQKGLERLKKYYMEQGYIQMNAAFVPEFREAIPRTQDAIVDMTFSLEEGDIFSIGKIEFTGNTQVNDGFLLAKLAIREGDLYKRSLFEKSIYNLNDLGMFELIRDEDFETQLNETTKQVDIIIHLKEKL